MRVIEAEQLKVVVCAWSSDYLYTRPSQSDTTYCGLMLCCCCVVHSLVNAELADTLSCYSLTITSPTVWFVSPYEDTTGRRFRLSRH